MNVDMYKETRNKEGFILLVTYPLLLILLYSHNRHVTYTRQSVPLSFSSSWQLRNVNTPINVSQLNNLYSTVIKPSVIPASDNKYFVGSRTTQKQQEKRKEKKKDI